MNRNFPLILWMAVLIGNLSICALFIAEVHPHPGAILMHHERMMQTVDERVSDSDRQMSREVHQKVAARMRGITRSYGKAFNIAALMCAISIIGVFVESKRRKRPQPATTPYSEPAARSPQG